MKSRQTNSETKYTRRPILPEIEFVNLPLVEFQSSIAAGARGPSLLQRYLYTEDRFTNLLANTIRTRKQQQQQKIMKNLMQNTLSMIT